MFTTILAAALAVVGIHAALARAGKRLARHPVGAMLLTGMALRDQSRVLNPVRAMAPQIDNASDTNGAAIDMQGYRALTVVIHTGTITDGTHSPKLQEADDDGTGSPDTWSDVAAADVNGSFSDLGDDETQWVGYRGVKRHVRLVVEVTGATTGGDYSAVGIQGNPTDAPTQ